MKNKIIFGLIFCSSFAFIISCNKQSTLFPTGTETLVLPSTTANYRQSNNLVDDKKATLGRVLFYDKHLSLNNSVSCGSCHKQANGFADNKAGSLGLDNKTTPRNALAIQNLSLNDSAFMFLTNGVPSFGSQHLFWDNRETQLRDLMLRPVGNHIEMGITDIATLPAKLNNLPYYKALVLDAYGTDKLDVNNIADALANFNASIRTVNSRFDKFVLGDNNAINAQEKVGLALFTSAQYNCVSCHTSMFSVNNVNNGGSVYGGGSGDSSTNFSANIGLTSNNSDGGLGNVTSNSKDKGSFKIPDLHNVALTAPYMHDGSKATLNDVLEHYSNNINTNNNLDNRLRNSDGTPKRMHIPEQDKIAIIAFLNSLTDAQVISDPKLSNPFIIK